MKIDEIISLGKKYGFVLFIVSSLGLGTFFEGLRPVIADQLDERIVLHNQ